MINISKIVTLTVNCLNLIETVGIDIAELNDKRRAVNLAGRDWRDEDIDQFAQEARAAVDELGNISAGFSWTQK